MIENMECVKSKESKLNGNTCVPYFEISKTNLHLRFSKNLKPQVTTPLNYWVFILFHQVLRGM